MVAAALIGGLAGDGDDDEGIGHVAVGDEALGAVEDVVLAGLIQDGGGLLTLGVGAGAGLGQTESADLAGRSTGRADTFSSAPRCRSQRWERQHREVWAETITAVVPQTLASSSTHMA